MNFGGIFDNGEAVFLSGAKEGIHVHRMSIDVNRHDSARAGGDLLLDLCNVHAPGFRIAVDEDWNTAAVDDGNGAGDYGEGGQNDFIARFEVQTFHGNLEGRSSVADRNAILSAAVSCPLLFKLIDKPASRGNPSCF